MAQTALVARSAERWVLIASILASSMAFIDQSALDVASPRLQADLGLSAPQLFWVSTAYALMLAALLLVGGALGDLYGRKRVFMIGIGIFTAASVACGLAPNGDWLIAARAVQGIGGALLVPGSLAILSATFPDDRRGAAIGTWSTFSPLTTLLGPLFGGWLAEQGLWRVVFLINVPLGAIALFLLATQVPETRASNTDRKLDLLGAALITLSLALLTIGFTIGQQADDPLVPLLTLAGGAAALIAFVVVEARSPHPMVPLRLFSNRTFAGTNLLTLLLYAALRVSPYFAGLVLQQVQGYPADVAGLTFLPLAVCLILLSRFAGGLVARVGARPLLTIGPALAGAGFLVFGLPGIGSGPETYWTTYFPAVLLLGIGMGLTVAPLTTAVMGSAPRENAGAASGINNAVARVASVLALTIVGGLAVSSFQASLSARVATIAMDDAQRQAVMAASVDLGATQPPADMSAPLVAETELAVKLAFLDANRLVAVIAAVLAWMSAAIGFFMVGPRRGAENSPLPAPMPVEA